MGKITNDITPDKCAFALMTYGDEAFAEVFAYAKKFHDMGICGDGGYDFPENTTLGREDMENVSTGFLDWIKASVQEIIFSEECDTSAWWKQEGK